MKTPTPTEVKMSVLDKHHFTSRKPNPQPITDFPATKPSRLARRQKSAWKRQRGYTLLEILGWIVYAIAMLFLLIGVPK